jgi:E-phenylitaconyl-CoA hydratase
MPITTKKEGGVATITLDRPEKLNALDVEHLIELRAQLASASADPAVGVIVMTGASTKSFCVGADLTASRNDEAGVAEAFGFDLGSSGQRGLYIRLLDISGLNLRKPLIAAVNGYCLGGGLELALQCDVLVASETASFGLPEVVVASVPGAGGVPNLLRAVPRAIAMHMLLSGERISAKRAVEIGLASAVYPADSFPTDVAALAEKIAGNGPLAVQMVKMLAQQSASMGPAQAMQLTELAWGLLRDTEDRNEGRKAFPKNDQRSTQDDNPQKQRQT